MDLEAIHRAMYPYAERYGVIREFPEEGMDREAILAQLREMSPRRTPSGRAARSRAASTTASTSTTTSSTSASGTSTTPTRSSATCARR